ncbi:MAG: hypothetical protein Rhob2KO_17270 [Rhodopirellula baltica]
MKVYHGTNDTNATAIASKIDVKKGGGELGRGFYAGENIALAAAWAQGRFGSKNAKVVEIDVPNSDFVSLSIKQIGHVRRLMRLWYRLQKKRTTRTYLFGSDVVVAPFATISFSNQYKFESKTAETTLNSKATVRIL